MTRKSKCCICSSEKGPAECKQYVHFVTSDLQKTLPLPKLSTSTAFYLRQMWLYNLGVHLVSDKESRGYFQIWTEIEGYTRTEGEEE